jgi:hypothetical protein
MSRECIDCERENLHDEDFYPKTRTICKQCCIRRSRLYRLRHAGKKYPSAIHPFANRTHYRRKGGGWLNALQYYGFHFALRSNGQIGHDERMELNMKRIMTALVMVLLLLSLATVFAANEMSIQYTTGQTLYAVRFNSAGEAGLTDGSTFEAWGTEGRGANSYDVGMAEVGGGCYTGNWGTTVSGRFTYVVYLQAGGSPADGDTRLGIGNVIWTGTAETFDVTDPCVQAYLATNKTQRDANDATILASISASDTNTTTKFATNRTQRDVNDTAVLSGVTTGFATNKTQRDADTATLVALAFNPSTTGVKLTATGLNAITMTDPNATPTGWTPTDWYIYNTMNRWSMQTIADHNHNTFTIYNSAGAAIAVQDFNFAGEGNTLSETISKVRAP